MLFHADEFREAVSDAGSRKINHVLAKLIHSLRHHQEPLYLVRMIEEIAGILRSQSESPVLKFKTAKALMYLIVMGEPQIVEQLGDEIFPMIRNACLFNRFHPLLTRGMDFFRTNKYYEVANFEQKTKIKNVGCRYITFCLEFVYILSQWLPKEEKTKKESIFLASYKMLLKEGVQFPRPDQLIFFSEDRIKKIEQQLKGCESEAEQLKADVEQQYLQGDRVRFDAEMMNGVEYLQRKLRQKEKIISEMKYNTSVNQFERQSVLMKLKEQESNHNVKVEVYEKKIATLTEEVRKMKELVKLEQRRSPEKEHRDRELIASLEARIQLLNYENSQLKQELAKKSSIMESYSKPSPSKSFTTANMKSQRHIKQLLELCEEQQEYSPRQPRYKSAQQVDFFDYNDPRAPFYPFYDLLTQQMQIRFRKCLLKSKEILYKSRKMQIGVLSSLKNEIEIEMTFIVTNLCDKAIIIELIDYHFTKELAVVNSSPLNGKKKLKVGEQFKHELKVIVNSIDGRCPNLIIKYGLEDQQVEELSLIVPVSKLKLMETLPFSSHSRKDWKGLQRVIVLQKRILSKPSKLKDYWSRCFLEKHNDSVEYCFKIKVLETIFYLRLNPIGDETLRILVNFQMESKCLAQKLMNQLQFILSK